MLYSPFAISSDWFFIPTNVASGLDEAGVQVLMDRVKAIASGFGVSDHPAAYEAIAAEQYKKFHTQKNHNRRVPSDQ